MGMIMTITGRFAQIGVLGTLCIALLGFAGCAVFGLAGDVVGATGDIVGASFDVAKAGVRAPVEVVKAVIEVPADIVESTVGVATSDHRGRCTVHRSWTVGSDDVSLLDVETANGSITVEGSDTAEIRIKSWVTVQSRSERAAEEFADRVTTRVLREGERLRIHRECPSKPRRTSVSVRYEIVVPASVELDLRSSNGQITVAHVTANVRARTSNGKIHVHHSEGEFDLHTSNGKVDLKSVSGRVNARTSNGRIELLSERLDEGVFVSSNGAVDATVLEQAGVVDITTTNGGIDLALPGDYQGHLDARTSSGSIHSEFAVVPEKRSKRRLVGVIGTSGSGCVSLDTSNGSIRLKTAK